MQMYDRMEELTNEWMKKMITQMKERLALMERALDFVIKIFAWQFDRSTDRQTHGQTDYQTDRPTNTASYEDVRTHTRTQLTSVLYKGRVKESKAIRKQDGEMIKTLTRDENVAASLSDATG